MGGPRLRCILHDGDRIRDNRQVPKAFLGSRVREFTEAVYSTKSVHCKGLGDEITSINGIAKQGKDGWQVYIAIIKEGKVVEMGLPHVKGPSGKANFLNASNMRLADLDKNLDALPGDVELAIVWRLDRGMTQDITLSERSLINRLVPQGQDFSLLDLKPAVGCGGGFGGDSEAVYDLTQVFIYTGEQDAPIRLSNVRMAAPPESAQWDSPDMFQQPIPAPETQRQAPSHNQSVTDLTMRMCWKDSLPDMAQVTVDIIREPDAEGGLEAKEAPAETPAAIVMILWSGLQDPKIAPMPLLNRAERVLVDRLHAKPFRGIAIPSSPILRRAKPQAKKASGFVRAPALEAMPAKAPEPFKAAAPKEAPKARSPKAPSLHHPARGADHVRVPAQRSPEVKQGPRHRPQNAAPAKSGKRKAKSANVRTEAKIPKAKPKPAMRKRPDPAQKAEPGQRKPQDKAKPPAASKRMPKADALRPSKEAKPLPRATQKKEKKGRSRDSLKVLLRSGRTRAGSSRGRRSRSRTSTLLLGACSSRSRRRGGSRRRPGAAAD